MYNPMVNSIDSAVPIYPTVSTTAVTATIRSTDDHFDHQLVNANAM